MAAYFPLPAEDNGLYEIYNTSILYLYFFLFNCIEKFAEQPSLGGGGGEKKKKKKKKQKKCRACKMFMHTACSSKYKKLYL